MGHDTSMLEDGWIIFDGLPMYYRTNALPVPAGARTIIHIHGFGISGTYLLPTAALLADRYATWVPDLPGFGRSIHPPRALTIDDMADAVARFMDAQGIDRAVLLGNSLGCPVTLAFVEQHPDRIEAAVLVSPRGWPHNLPIWRGAMQLVRRRARTVGYGADRCPRLPSTMDPSDHRAVPVDAPLPGRAATAEATLPTLVVIGDRDPLVDEARVKACRRPLPHVTALAIDGAAHAINFSIPDSWRMSSVPSWKAGPSRRSEPAGSGADDPSPVAG